jgi:hypothetical protein
MAVGKEEPMALTLGRLDAQLCIPPADGAFTADEVAGLPAPVQRYLRWAIAPGTRLAQAAHLQMEGRVKIGRWLPFRAEELLAPHAGFVWPARTLGLAGSDRCVDGHGALDWKLFGRVPVIHAEGPDVSRSAANRGAAEAIWVPTALLPRFGVEWDAVDHSHLVARYAMGGHPVEQHLHVDPGTGRLLRFHLDRWGDPDESGTWRPVSFGGDATAWSSFEGVSVPSAGRVGWYYGTPDFLPRGEFFRYEITGLRLVR